MRQIKFRIWDSEDKKFFTPIYEAYAGRLCDLSISTAGSIIRRTLEHCAEHESRFENRYIINQYTGLNDKNGKEIYESDIVQCGYGRGKVIFHAGCYLVEWIDDREAAMEFLFSRKGRALRINEDEFEVIGNEYENPE